MAIKNLKERAPTGQLTAALVLRRIAWQLAWRYANGQMSIDQIVNQVLAHTEEDMLYLMLNVASYLPDSDEIQVRKHLAGRTNRG